MKKKKKTVSRTVTVNRQFLNIFFYNVTCHNNKKQQTWLMQFHIAIDACSKMGIVYKIEPNHENSHFVLISPPVSFAFTISFSLPFTKNIHVSFNRQTDSPIAVNKTDRDDLQTIKI